MRPSREHQVVLAAIVLLTGGCGRTAEPTVDPAGQTGAAVQPAPSDTGSVASGADADFEGSAAVWREAALRNVVFRAVGQEPGWVLEIVGDERIDLVTDYGDNRFTTPVPEPALGLEDGVVVFHAATETADLRLTIRNQPCSDTMSGEPFPQTVTVVINGHEYHGCGRRVERAEAL